jgi:RHS repeat-associated protein
LIQRTDSLKGVPAQTISYGYDLAGNKTSMTTPSGTVSYTYDSRNRLDKVIQNSITLTDYDYNAVNNLTTTTFSNGTQESRQYDLLNRLSYLENRKGNDILSSYRYTLDKVGNRTQITEQDGRVSNYIYDDLYRLTQEKINDPTNGNRETDFVYDKVGNRLGQSETINGTVKTMGYVYDANDRLFTETNNGQNTTYGYDNNGNTVRKQDGNGATLYTWNDEGRLVEVIVQDANGNPLQQMGYRYNANGIRVMSSTNEQATFYLLDEVQAYAQVVAVYGATGVTQVSYIYGNDLINQTRNSQTTFDLVDGLGSTRILTDAQGNVLNAYDYEAFGETINQSGTVQNQYLFTGEQFDTGLEDYYLRDRFYSESTGLFTRRDVYEGQSGEPLTLHDYFYAHNNPINRTDPTGFFSLGEVLVSFTLAANLTGIVSFTPSIVAGSRERENSDTVVIYAGTGTVAPLTWAFGHAFIEVDGEIYTFPPSEGLPDPAPRDAYVMGAQAEFGYEYNRYSINYDKNEKQILKANLINNRQSPFSDKSNYDLFTRNCTHYLTSSLPKLDLCFDSFVKTQIDPIGLGWGLDVIAATQKNLVKRLTKVQRTLPPDWKWGF